MFFLFKKFIWIFFIYIGIINGGRIVGNIIRRHNILDNAQFLNNLDEITIKNFIGNFHKQNKVNYKNMLNAISNEKMNEQWIITNKNNLIYCEKDKELFLEDNDFIKNKKLISISPGGLKGFYELGVLSYIKDNYNMENYIFSGASAGAWNALFMCFKNDTKQFVFSLLSDYKLSQVKSVNELEYYLKYKLLLQYNSTDFDLRRLFIGVTTLKNFRPVTNIFSDFNNLEDAINCCIASSHIPLITGGLTNRYHNKYVFDGGFSKYPYLNFTENVLHITPGMWKKLNNKDKTFLNKFASLDIIIELFLITKEKNYMQLFDYGYQDAKLHKPLLNNIFLDINNEKNDDNNNNNTSSIETNELSGSYIEEQNDRDLLKDNDSY
jgi:hypothetical protein